MQDEIYFTQNRIIIKELADKGPCVIVGRCADYILREREDCLNVFIFADNESKIERAEKYFNITREEAPAVLKKKIKPVQIIINIIQIRNGAWLPIMICV